MHALVSLGLSVLPIPTQLVLQLPTADPAGDRNFFVNVRTTLLKPRIITAELHMDFPAETAVISHVTLTQA